MVTPELAKVVTEGTGNGWSKVNLETLPGLTKQIRIT
jgi:hypothetical protein